MAIRRTTNLEPGTFVCRLVNIEEWSRESNNHVNRGSRQKITEFPGDLMIIVLLVIGCFTFLWIYGERDRIALDGGAVLADGCGDQGYGAKVGRSVPVDLIGSAVGWKDGADYFGCAVLLVA